MPAIRSLNVWMPCRQPPSSSASPRIRSTFPITEPMIDARAMSARPASIASTRITTSGRLPKLALSRAETRGPAELAGLLGGLAQRPGQPGHAHARHDEHQLALDARHLQPQRQRGDAEDDGERASAATASQVPDRRCDDPVDRHQLRALQPVRLAVGAISAVMKTAAASATTWIGGNSRSKWCGVSSEMNTSSGATPSAICSDEPERHQHREVHVVLVGDLDADDVLGDVADQRHDDQAQEHGRDAEIGDHLRRAYPRTRRRSRRRRPSRAAAAASPAAPSSADRSVRGRRHGAASGVRK